MRNTERYRLAKQLIPHMPGFATRKDGEIFIAPIGNVLRGFLFESTPGPREDFYFWWFFMPILRPIDHIVLSNGARLNVPGGHAGWRTDMAELPEKLLTAMSATALPFLRAINTNQDAIDALHLRRAEPPSGPLQTRQIRDIYVQHDVACLLILDGRYEEAETMLDLAVAHEHGTDRRQWLLDVAERAKGLRQKLLASPELAVSQIREWQDYSFSALKLEKWR